MDLKSDNGKRRTFGKRVGGALYLHRSALDALSEEDRQHMHRAEASIPEGFVWSVLKLDRRSSTQVSFLDYEDFEAVAFPALKRSCTVEVNSGKAVVRRYCPDNPPILHRKELLLQDSDPRRTEFSDLTQRLERLGLFKNMSRMGRRRPWEDALMSAGLDVNGGSLD